MPFRARLPFQKPRPHRTLPHEVGGALRLLHQAILARTASKAAPAEPPPPSAGLVVASYNVHRCIGVDNRFDPGRIAAVIEELGADIVALQEADRRFGHRAGLLNLAALQRRTGLKLIPVSPIAGGHGWRGNALLVRGGRATRIRRLALPGAEPRGAVIVDLAMADGPLRVAAAHLGLMRRHRAMQAEAILDALDELPTLPTILLGDLNEWRTGVHSSLNRLEGRFGRFPQQPSFPSRLPFLALDQIMGDPSGLVLPPWVHDSPLARLASDHLPLAARLDLAAAQAVPESAAA